MKDFRANIEFVDPESITPYANNTKKHPTEQVDKIAAQIHKFGFDQPIVVDRNRVIIKGHGRREAALRLGLKEVPVIIADLDEYEAMAARIADNKVAESEWEEDILKFEFGTLERNGMDMSLTGFDEDELKKLMKEAEESGSSTPSQSKPAETEQQYIVAIDCKDESEMQQIFDEMQSRGFQCRLIT